MKISLKDYFKLLTKYLKPLWKSTLLLAILMTGSIALQLLNPQILRDFIDAAKGREAMKSLIMGAVWFIVISILQQAFAVFSTYMCQNVGWRATNALREELVLHCIGLDMDFHKSRQPGEMIERLDSDVNMLFDFFSKLVLDILNNVALIAGILILLIREDWRISAALTVFAASSIVVLSKAQAKGVPLWVKHREANARLFGLLGEQISSTEDIKASGAVKYCVHRYLKAIHDLFPIEVKAVMVHFKLWNISTMLSATATIIGLGFGGYLWKQGVITIGTVYLIFNYTELISGPLHQIRRNLGDLQKATASILRVQELFSMESSMRKGHGKLESKDTASIEVKDIHFEYTSDVPVLRGISMKLEPGRILGIVGRTGSGKTTLARLIARLYEPSSGEITINGREISSIDPESLRKHIAYVTQDVQLFHASIRDNLTLFDQDISDEAIMSALSETGLRDWIEGMPEGLDTMLEAGGGSLSSGEAQLLAFVRVFLRNPGLVILDEASSRLDPITERYMERAIDRLLENRSCIMIAHRLSTLQRADDILILDNGEAVEYGKRDELIRDKGSRYSQLLQKGIEEVLV